jgi:hypothetical protein
MVLDVIDDGLIVGDGAHEISGIFFNGQDLLACNLEWEEFFWKLF